MDNPIQSSPNKSEQEKDLIDLPGVIADNIRNPHKYMPIKKQLLIAAAILFAFYGTSWLVITLSQKNPQFHDFLSKFGIPVGLMLLSSVMILWGLINISTKVDNWFTNFLQSIGLSNGFITRWKRGLFVSGVWFFGLGGGAYKSRFYGYILTFLGLFLLIIFSSSIFLSPSTNTQTSNQVQQQVQQPVTKVPEEIKDLPIYPEAIFEKKQDMPTCIQAAEEIKKDYPDHFDFILNSRKDQRGCDATAYTFTTYDDVEKIVNWYSDDESKSGWKLTGGAGQGGVERFGQFSNGIKHYFLYIGIDRTTDKEFKYFDIRIPKESTVDTSN